MGSGASNTRESASLVVYLKGVDGVTDPSSDSYDVLDFKSRLTSPAEMLKFKTIADSRNNSYLLDIWELVSDYSAIEINDLFVEKISVLLQPHLDCYPMCVEFLNLCSERKGGHINPRAFVLLYHIHQLCFHFIFKDIFKPYIDSIEFKALNIQNNSNNNELSHNSFHYLTVIAQGGFGIVLKCRKISSGLDYAMKIQPKSVLLRHHRKDKSRVTSELEASVVFSHPYIASIAYAFQTETMVMLVSPISACGDLRRSLNLCPNKRMSLDRVVFYAAEIVSALIYLHKNNIMYRDLKPPNVLLHADGHIMLADFGSLAGMSR